MFGCYVSCDGRVLDGDKYLRLRGKEGDGGGGSGSLV